MACESDEPAELALFGETGARAVVSVPASSLARVLALAAQYGVARARDRSRHARRSSSSRHNGATVVRDSSASLRAIWAGAIERAVLGERASEQP